MNRTKILALAAAVALLCAQPALAATILFEISLDGLQETPPVATPGLGFGELTLNDATGAYSISGNFQDLIGTTVNAHIHGPADFGEPAGVVVGLTFDAGVTSGTFSGAGTFNATQMSELLDEKYYVNIHTTHQLGGEIRGQIRIVPEPGSVVLLSCGGLALITVAWRRARRRC